MISLDTCIYISILLILIINWSTELKKIFSIPLSETDLSSKKYMCFPKIYKALRILSTILCFGNLILFYYVGLSELTIEFLFVTGTVFICADITRMIQKRGAKEYYKGRIMIGFYICMLLLFIYMWFD